MLHAPGIESLTLGGELRLRLESRDAFPPTTAGSSQTTQLGRIRLNLDARMNDQFGAFVELQESIVNQGSVDGNGEVHQAYGSWTNALEGLDIVVGRMELDYGLGRQVSSFDWINTGYAFDGALVGWTSSDRVFSVDAFWTEAVLGQGGGAANEDLGGLVIEVAPEWEANIDFEVYGFKRRNPAAGLDDLTLGVLAMGDYSGGGEGILWNAEFATQSGDHAGGALDAAGTMFDVAAYYRFDGGFMVGAGIGISSGDDNGADSDQSTFIRLYPDDHSFNGLQDIVVNQNLTDIRVDAMLPLDGDNWELYGAVHLLSQTEKTDAVYTGMGGGVVVNNPGDDSIGTEIDLTLRGNLSEQVDLYVGLGQFSAGDGIVSSDDQLWLFAQVAFYF